MIAFIINFLYSGSISPAILSVLQSSLCIINNKYILKPFLCAFSDNDPIFAGVENSFLKNIPGCENMPHVTIENAGHFLQEDNPDACVNAIMSIMDF